MILDQEKLTILSDIIEICPDYECASSQIFQNWKSLGERLPKCIPRLHMLQKNTNTSRIPLCRTNNSYRHDAET